MTNSCAKITLTVVTFVFVIRAAMFAVCCQKDTCTSYELAAPTAARNEMASYCSIQVLMMIIQVTFIKADYDCLCSYEVETKIFDAPSDKGHVIGFMYEFDCKPTLKITNQDKTYQPIGHEHQIGYVHVTANMQFQICQGTVPFIDQLTTTPRPIITATTSGAAQSSQIVTATRPISTSAHTTSSTTLTTVPSATSKSTSTSPTTTTSTTTSLPTTSTSTTPTLKTTPRTSQTTATSLTSKTTTTPTTFTVTATTSSTTVSTILSTTLTNPTTKPTTIKTTPSKKTSARTVTQYSISSASTNVSTPTSTRISTTPSTTVSTTLSTTLSTSPSTTVSTSTSTTVSTKPSTTVLITPSAKTLTTGVSMTTSLSSIHGNIHFCPKSLIQKSMPDYIYQYGSFCYEHSSKIGTWYDGKSDCAGKGGVMFYLQNKNQQDFIIKMLHDVGAGYFPVWLGIIDAGQEESWKWLSGEPLTYTNWMPGRFEDDFHDQEDCGLFVAHRHGQWDDIICTGTLFSEPANHHWICQYNTTASASGK